MIKGKVQEGIVVSDKCDKTCVVEVERILSHPLYKKIIKKKRKFIVHDEGNQCKIGDFVRIIETRPISKRKRWKIIEILKRGQKYDTSADTIESSG